VKGRDFQEGDRVVWTSPLNPGPLVGKIVARVFRNHSIFTVDLDNGRKVAAHRNNLKPVGQS